jgi:hypothetical protein
MEARERGCRRWGEDKRQREEKQRRKRKETS